MVFVFYTYPSPCPLLSLLLQALPSSAEEPIEDRKACVFSRHSWLPFPLCLIFVFGQNTINHGCRGGGEVTPCLWSLYWLLRVPAVLSSQLHKCLYLLHGSLLLNGWLLQHLLHGNLELSELLYWYIIKMAVKTKQLTLVPSPHTRTSYQKLRGVQQGKTILKPTSRVTSYKRATMSSINRL